MYFDEVKKNFGFGCMRLPIVWAAFMLQTAAGRILCC